MNKKIVSYVLLNSLLVQIMLTSLGCHAFYPPNDNKDLEENINSKERLLIKLKDQTQLDLESGSYLFVNKPSEFICGIGYKYGFSNRTGPKFISSLSKNEIDSNQTFIYGSTIVIKYWLNNNENIMFEKEKILNITPASGSGFWIVLDSDESALRMIEYADIEEIQIHKTNWVATIALLAVITGIIAMSIAASQFSGGVSAGAGSF
jgi:hypothetical protein